MGLLRDSTITFSTRILIFVLQIITGIILARVLGPTGRGEFALLILIPTFIVMIGSLGIEVSNIYFTGSNKYNIKYIISSSLISAVLFGLIGIVITFLCFDYIQEIFLKDVHASYLKITIFCVPFLLLNTYFLNILLGKKFVFKYNMANIFHRFLYLILIVIFLLVLKYNTYGAIISWFASTSLTSLFLIFSINSISRINLKFKLKVWKSSIVFGVKGYISNLLSYISYRVDMLMIGYFLAAGQVGLYAVAVMIAEIFWFISFSVSKVLAPRVASSTHSESNLLTSQASRNVIFLTSTSIFIFFLVDKFFMRLFFGVDFLPSVMPLRILYPGIIALALGRVIYSDLLGRGKPEIAMIASIVAVTFNIALNLYLIPNFGISGAALASSISYSVSAIIGLLWFIKITHCNWRDVLIIKKVDLKNYWIIFNKLKKMNK